MTILRLFIVAMLLIHFPVNVLFADNAAKTNQHVDSNKDAQKNVSADDTTSVRVNEKAYTLALQSANSTISFLQNQITVFLTIATVVIGGLGILQLRNSRNIKDLEEKIEGAEKTINTALKKAEQTEQKSEAVLTRLEAAIQNYEQKIGAINNTANTQDSVQDTYESPSSTSKGN